jgi:hypothetical protein
MMFLYLNIPSSDAVSCIEDSPPQQIPAAKAQNTPKAACAENAS